MLAHHMDNDYCFLFLFNYSVSTALFFCIETV